MLRPGKVEDLGRPQNSAILMSRIFSHTCLFTVQTLLIDVLLMAQNGIYTMHHPETLLEFVFWFQLAATSLVPSFMGMMLLYGHCWHRCPEELCKFCNSQG